MEKLLIIETNTNKKILGPTPAEASTQIYTLPVGTIIAYGGATVPTGYLLCNGANNVSKTTYPELWSAIQETWGVGIDVDHFKIPDLNGRFLRGTGSNAAALGVAQDQATKKNLLSASATLASYSQNFNFSGSASTTPNHAHTLNNSNFGTTKVAAGGAGGGAMASGSSVGTQTLTYFNWLISLNSASSSNGGHTVTGTINIAHTHTAPTVSFNDGDIETRPDNRAVNFIIKY